MNGIYSVAPGLSQLNKAERADDRLIFQADDHYLQYIGNKRTCRTENPQKYFREEALPAATAAAVNQYMAGQLAIEHPALFTFTALNEHVEFHNRITGETLQWGPDWRNEESGAYSSLFDALCCQVQEDVVICQLEDDKDRLAAIHLSAPNHWAAGDKIGRPFDEVHQHVPGMEKTMPHYPSMLKSIIHKGPFTRFAWGLASDDRLNHHPVPPPGFDEKEWRGRQFDTDTTDMFLRVERQNTIGFPQCDAFLFTIRTYFYEISSLNEAERTALLLAAESMSLRSQEYKGLLGKLPLFRQYLQR